jgi:hypothetical protein
MTEMGVDKFRETGQVIGAGLTGGSGDAEKAELSALAEAFPLYPHVAPTAV